MPGPAIYVVAALGTVVALAAFKEFIFDPHLRPKLEAWQETLREQRRQKIRRRNGLNAPFPVPNDEDSSSSSEDDAPLSPSLGTGSGYSEPPIPLNDIVSRGVNEWRSSIETGRDPSGMRRRGHPSSSDRTVRPNYMDQNDSTSLSTPTLRPILDVERPSAPFSRTNFPPEPTSPTSTLNSDFLSDSAFSSPRSHEYLLDAGIPIAAFSVHSPDIPTFEAPVTVPTPISRIPGAFTESPGTTHPSTPDTDFPATSAFATADDYFTAGVASESTTPSAGRSRASSPDFVVRPADESPQPMSPFLDMRVPDTRTPSPLVLDEFLSPSATVEDLPSDVEFGSSSSDDEMYSLPSHVPSEMDSDSMPDDEFDTVSEASSWAGIDGFADARR
ncbi:hypothetical protein OF83DRAFT_1118761 [Amylostereum chailletii]|nr:hypothetical protein OF83DRAFT_1118761 [Amylostereum chailletii]